MNEPDKSIIELLQRKYSPFTALAGESAEAKKCEICGAYVTKYAILKSTHRPDVPLRTCLGLCPQLLLSMVEYAQLIAPAIESDDLSLGDLPKGLAEAMVEASEAALEATTLDAEALSQLVKTARKYKLAGFGKKWRVVPGILEDYDLKKTLTRAQSATLETFIHSCKREYEKEPSYGTR